MSILTDEFVSLDGNDLSQYLMQADVPEEVEQVDDTTMGAAVDTKKNEAGLMSWTATLRFKQVWASVDAIIDPLKGPAVAAWPFIYRPDSAAEAAGNPARTGNAVIQSYTPVSGSVGDHQECTVVLNCSGTLVRTIGA